MCGDLRPYKDFVDLCVHNQSAVCNFRAIIPFMRRIWTDDDTGWIMSIALSGGISATPRRIFFLSLFFRDRRSWSGGVFVPFARNTPYTGVSALRVKRCAEHKECNRDCQHNFHRFHFHILSSVKVSKPGTQTDARCGKFKKDLNNCAVILPAFSSLLRAYSFSKTRNLSSSILPSRPR